MPVQAPAPKPSKIKWALAAILCACTLVALWVTGARVKALKLAARRGEVIDPVGSTAGETGRTKLVLRRNGRQRVEHFTVQFNPPGSLSVLDAGGRELVEFPKLKKGQLRRWQELELTFLEVSPDALTVETEIKPGATCFGGGRYRALRQGLQIQFPGNRSITLLAWDPQKPEITLRFQMAQETQDRAMGLDLGRGFGMDYQLQREPDGTFGLLIDADE